MKLFDLHCDTLYEMFKRQQGFNSNSLDISLDKAQNYDEYNQIMAVWSEDKLSEEEAWQQFWHVIEYKNANIPGTFPHYIAVEGGKLLCGDLQRLDRLYEVGVRFLTLVWKDTCCIGGAYNTNDGLTAFGKQVLNRCFVIGIIPDVSHASDKMFREVADSSMKLGKPFVATHSNSRSICKHMRNLSDEMFMQVKKSGGIVGISLAPEHLTSKPSCGIENVCEHILHYLSLGGEDTVCLGCDFDGIDSHPEGLCNISDVYKIANTLKEHGVSETQIEKIYYINAKNFITRNL